MKSWQQARRDSGRTGRLAGAATAVATAACGKVENGNPWAPLNAISHIAWGDKAFAQQAFSVQYTGGGLLLNDAAAGGWALLYEKLFGAAAEQGRVPVALLGGALTAGAAYLTDYHLLPARLTPGFEQWLSGRSLLVIYAALALALGLGGLQRKE